MIIDGNNLILGRMASYVAKNALFGDKMDIINCENCVVIGRKKAILDRYKKKLKMGVHSKGPFVPKMPDRFVKRVIRGMIPYKTAKGKAVFENIRCHISTPEKFKDKQIVTLEDINILNTKSINYIKVKEICKSIGGKI